MGSGHWPADVIEPLETGGVGTFLGKNFDLRGGGGGTVKSAT
jgi:hypothetical protein